MFAILSKHSLYKELSANLTVAPIPNMAAYSAATLDDGSDVSKDGQRLEESVLIAALEYVVAVGKYVMQRHFYIDS